MKPLTLLSRFLGFLLAAVAMLLSWFPSNLLGFRDRATAEIRERNGGFIAGVCHPEYSQQQTDLMLDAHLNWIRVDLPFPYLPDGAPNPFYELWVAGARAYTERTGVKIMGITPYPKTFIACGLDPRSAEDVPAIQDIARKYATDFAGVVSAFQITNEMGVPRFTEPLTTDEAVRFIAMQAEAMAPLKGDALLGYNLGGQGIIKLPLKMRRYGDYFDFVGLDLYLGSFENVTKNLEMNFEVMNAVRLATGKPIILTEFGYIGCGEPKTTAQKNEILRAYGFENEKAARADINTFIERLPKRLKKEFLLLYGDRSDKQKGDLLFGVEYSNHVYRALQDGTGLFGYPHTPEGQAKYYADMLARLQKIDWCAGAFIYMWNDSKRCYVCGQSDCPVETGWGLMDANLEPKPAYYAVKEALG